jgi:hypothetical protein
MRLNSTNGLISREPIVSKLKHITLPYGIDIKVHTGHNVKIIKSKLADAIAVQFKAIADEDDWMPDETAVRSVVKALESMILLHSCNRHNVTGKGYLKGLDAAIKAAAEVLYKQRKETLNAV